MSILDNCFLSKIDIVVNKKLPKTPNVPNTIQKIYNHTQHDIAKRVLWILL